MKSSSFTLFGFLAFFLVQSISSQTLLENLRCLICKQIVEDLDIELKNVDPKKKVDIGNYRIDAAGNTQQNKIPYALSEMHISESLEKVCTGIDDYVRAVRKDSGELILMKLIVDGQMNSLMSEVEIVQDGDLNKSLKYYCDGIVEEFEENIVKFIQNKEHSLEQKLCTQTAKLCVLGPAREDL